MTGRQVEAALAELKAHPLNYNRHSEAQIGRLMASLEQFGQPKPIVIWRGLIIAGHGLAEAAKRLKWATLLASDVSEEWTEAQATAFVGADNELARLADPDEAALAALVASLKDVDAELASLAAGSDERLKELLATLDDGQAGEDPGAQVDRAEELRVKWGVEAGQLWQLGEHRLICGDCTDAAVVERVMGGERAALLVTSPPYADLRDYTEESNLDVAHLVKMFDFPALLFVVNLGLILRNRQIVPYWDEYIKAAADRKLPLLAWNVWDKGHASAPAHQQAMFGLCHEWVFVFGQYRELNLTVPNKRAGEDSWAEPTVRERDASLKRHTHFPVRSHRQLDTVLRFAAIKNYSAEHTGHPAQFPTQFAEEYVSAASNDGQLVVDPFLGSGTTLIACERLGRRCRAVEISPGYVAVALERWAVMTGQTPRLVERATDFGNG